MIKIPIIDLFAGPGGLGEGFSAYTCKETKKPVFHIGLSIEKDPYAHQTLELRSFFRQFPKGEVPEYYYEYIRQKSLTTTPKEQEKLRSDLFEKYPNEAKRAKKEAWHAELGKDQDLNKRIDARVEEIKNAPNVDNWGLIGGPPCQAYSVIGRSRNKSISGYRSENDSRSYLYKQYLRVIACHEPDFFIMENVKGILSAKLDGKPLFSKMLKDLQYPKHYLGKETKEIQDLEYQIYPLASDALTPTKPTDFLIETENYGIPQARHRVILLGVKKSFSRFSPERLKRRKKFITTKEIISNLPRIRSGISNLKYGDRNPDRWLNSLKSITESTWLNKCKNKDIKEIIEVVLSNIDNSIPPQGGEFVNHKISNLEQKDLTEWFIDKKLRGVCNHTSRNHMISDLHRYLYSSVFAERNNRSPSMEDFPKELLPAHKSARSGNFNDRFRVQVADRPSATITSHISKDGHYFIHYDPEQCRSITVREAARLQTFPDNYFFEGSRTQQYIQVGNAVPPLLAKQIAEIVHSLIKRSY